MQNLNLPENLSLRLPNKLMWVYGFLAKLIGSKRKARENERDTMT